VAQAGAPKAVTIATNMAGRGTDIVLGGSLDASLEALGENPDEAEKARIRALWQQRHDAVLAAGGLHIVGTERHESRRIDNQLRGRSGRQGDPGSSRFFLSFEDNLMRIFASDFIQRAMRMMGMKEDDVIEAPMVSKQIEKAQRKVEAHNFDIRKNLLEFDDVANDQRKVIYQQRNDLLESDSVSDTIASIREDVIADVVRQFVPEHSVDEQWDLAGLERTLAEDFGWNEQLQSLHDHDDIDAAGIAKHVQAIAEAHFAEKEQQLGADDMRRLEKHVMLNVLDQNWKEHLAKMDYLRQGIHLRGFAQKQPKQEYKREAFELFSGMLTAIKAEVTQITTTVQIRAPEDVQAVELHEELSNVEYQHASYDEAQDFAEAAAAKAAPADAYPKVGRNDPCPCGSGKKYKQCHGKLT
jgi:preprotein translocase subunit SecA